MSRRRAPAAPIDWEALERVMRRSVVGGGTAEDYPLCQRAYRSDPERYVALSRRVRTEAFENERKKWSGL